jgi:hypothetical protein
MTAQEWLDELERLRKAAIMPPYYLRKKLFFGEDEEEYYITDKEERIICRMKYMSTEPDNAAYIVAACNAVPRLVEMIKYLSEEASGEAGGPGEWFMRTSEEVLQDAYQATEPKE